MSRCESDACDLLLAVMCLSRSPGIPMGWSRPSRRSAARWAQEKGKGSPFGRKRRPPVDFRWLLDWDR